MLAGRFLIAALLFCHLVAPVSAEAPAAAGRVEGTTGPTTGTCSAVLIATDLVLSAGHCRGRLFRPSNAEDNVYEVAEWVEHPLYSLPGQGSRRFRFDLSLARLAEAVPAAIATPLPVGAAADLGETLTVASWRTRSTAAAVEKDCLVIEGRPGMLTLDCEVFGGESGAPVLRRTNVGYEVVAILTSKSRQGDRPIAQAAHLEDRLLPMLSLLSNAD